MQVGSNRREDNGNAPAVAVNDAADYAPMVRWSELVEYRDFLRLLVWREVYLRYRHTLVGIGWSFINPLVTMAVFGLIVSSLVSPRTLASYTGGVPYAVWVFCGIVPWTCFAHALTRANTSLQDQGPLLKNTYFPRAMLPLSKVLAGLVELAVALLALVLIMAALRVHPSWNLALPPLFFIPLIAAALGAGLFLSVLQVRYRDMFFLAQFAMQLGLLVTPVWFPLSALPAPLRWAFAFNPMTTVVQGFRWSVLGVDKPAPEVLAVSSMTAALWMVAGLHVFRKRQETVADCV
jgi:lipopolysaccharide transport system permease protein